MKSPSILSVLLAGAAVFSSSILSAATTDPVGYVTETLKSDSFNLFGLNLASPVVVSGTFESSNETTLTDSDASFDTQLSPGSEYYVKILSGEGNVGINTSASASGATTILTADDISAVVSAGTQYEIRRVLTISDIFGADNSAELKGALAGDRTNADIVWIPDGEGGYTRVYYNETARTFPPLSVGWKTTGSADADASTTPVYFTDGMLIQVKRSTFDVAEAGVDELDLTRKNLTITGSVQTADSQLVLEQGFNFISRVFPGNVTLAESDLSQVIAHATAGDLTNADIIWVPDGAGAYNRYYYNGTARTFPPLSVGWKRTSAADADVS
ncbi:MAG TPA: hypothetical protein VJ952_10780, partial [Opitutales bacterium]|nr:hypothetical protein [Opitutales bacterium]